jgi:hypothetical protein
MRGLATLGWLLFMLALVAAPVRAEEIEIRSASLRLSEENLLLAADFEFELRPRLAEWVTNGVPLHFVVEFELKRIRWWWFDERIVARRLQTRLSYHALSRSYRLSTGLLQQNYASLEEALNVLRHVRGWPAAERSVLQPDATYQAAVRMRLDTSQLPRPFQLSALTSRELTLESAWLRFEYRSPAPGAAPVLPAPAAPPAPSSPSSPSPPSVPSAPFPPSTPSAPEPREPGEEAAR